MRSAAEVRIGVGGCEFRCGVRTGIRRSLMEILRAASHTRSPCIAYGAAATASDLV